MAHNDGVGDVSTIQTTPPCEIYLAAHVQKVHKMIADHVALTTLASHRLFLLKMSPRFFNSGMESPFNFAYCQLSGVAATAASTRKYSVPAVSTHAKDEKVTKAPAMSTNRTFQIAQDC
jgi:hypothetical protein